MSKPSLKKNIILSALTALIIIIAMPIVIKLIASASNPTNDLVFEADVTIDLSDPDTNLTVLANSQVDSMTVNADSIDLTMSTDGKITIRSDARKTMSHNSTSLPINYSCGNSYSEINIPALVGVSASEFTLTVTDDTCVTEGGAAAIAPPIVTTLITAPTEAPVTTEAPTAAEPATATEGPATEAPTTATPVASTPEAAQDIAPAAPTAPTAQEFAQKIVTITVEATEIVTAKAEQVAQKVGTSRNIQTEQKTQETYVTPLIISAGITASTQSQAAITNFIAYGTATTKVLGAGERAGVVNSFQNAFKKLPATKLDWQDAIKIANGRFPAQQSISKEKQALSPFTDIYKKLPDFSNGHDEAALKIITYGIRPTARNFDSEKAAIITFESVYGEKPATTSDWDIMRAIAYSGAKR